MIFTDKQVELRISKALERSPRVLLEIFNRVLGPLVPPDQNETTIFNIIGTPASKELTGVDDSDVIEGEVINE